jgi:hypothetical protein
MWARRSRDWNFFGIDGKNFGFDTMQPCGLWAPLTFIEIFSNSRNSTKIGLLGFAKSFEYGIQENIIYRLTAADNNICL